jgi:hypothetical protein
VQEFSKEYQASGCHVLTLETLKSIAGVLHNSVRPGMNREDFAFESLYTSVYHLLQAVSLELTAASSLSSSVTSTAAPAATNMTFNSMFPQIMSLSSQLSSTMQTLDLNTPVVFTVDHKKTVLLHVVCILEGCLR